MTDKTPAPKPVPKPVDTSQYKQLLEDGFITQSEYDTLVAATSKPTATKSKLSLIHI